MGLQAAHAMGMAMPEMPTFSALEGMEDEFAELMQSMQSNHVMMSTTAQSAAPRRGRNRDTRCLIVAIGTAADIKRMEAAALLESPKGVVTKIRLIK